MRSSDRAQVAPAPPRSLGPGALIEVVVDGLATRWPVSRRGGARCTPRFGASDRLRRSGGWVRRGADVHPLPLAAVWSRVPASWCARGTGGDTRMLTPPPHPLTPQSGTRRQRPRHAELVPLLDSTPKLPVCSYFSCPEEGLEPPTRGLAALWLHSSV